MKTTTLAGIASLALGLMTTCTARGAIFGPGAHWLDGVIGGTLPLPDALVEFGVDTTLDGNAEYNAKFIDGPTIITISNALDDSIYYPGTRAINGHLDVVDEQVTSMNMTGTAATTGWTLRAGTANGVATPTLGTIAEDSGDNTTATSFFDVFFEIDATPWGTVHNNSPVRIQGPTTELPPVYGSDYESVSTMPIGLYDSSNTLVANFTNLINGDPPHKQLPEPTAIGAAGLMITIGLSRWRR